MSLSIWQVVLVALLFILLFGRGKIPTLMSDLATGIKNFKHGIKDDKEDEDVKEDEDTLAQPSSSQSTSLKSNSTSTAANHQSSESSVEREQVN